MDILEVFGWLKDQAPVIVVMGVVIYWLSKQLIKERDRNDQLTENVIKIATLWEAKSQSLSEDDKEFKKEIYEKLSEITIILKTQK